MTLPIDVQLQLPEPRTPDPHDAPAIRWGVLGPGGIAHTFADAVAVGTASSVVAVGSRSRERAQDFADEFEIGRAYGSYEELVADPDVDAVYVASPHSEHRNHALLALEAGKPVLVEKAFTRSAAEAREVLAAAESRNLLVVEAMWSRFLPHYDVVRHVVETGLIGDLVTVFADHGQRLYPGGPARLSQPELAGGALLDLGVYPVSFADLVLGAPASVSAVGGLTDLGVDATTTITVTGGSGAHGVLSCTMAAVTPCSAVVAGTEARLELSGTFYAPGSTIRLVNRVGEVIDERPGGLADDVRGFSYEAAEFARCLVAGERESPIMPHATTLRVMETMDEVRRQVGVVYPGE
ncbi:Gfo/Idh/MocA family protein [Terrabacter sp. MAHUQ-38]|uniref:Gfo/Idh/MocA family protein n=1 Tax=unclassified Terrabacter TaxID=2630222 RepID=UPI00165E5C67|nr:Gfo/Idh/MocA family oxidoreductase [Terrabacter sp. MAHUQ-38]MBC9819946.1 Gfo/Idh/MocA family oxidoreductase [Terrabacter sp. MAHUQ-38]